MGQRINELPSAQAITDNSMFVTQVGTGTTQSVLASILLAYIQDNITAGMDLNALIEGNSISIEKDLVNNTATFKLHIPTFDSTLAYTVGNYVIYNNAMYVFINNQAAGTPWTSANVQLIGASGGGASSVTVGTTTTLAPGQNATVVNSGTASDLVLDFGIPRGADGDDGADGDAATIAVGTVTTGAAGTNASVTNSGSSSAAIFDFVIPRGADGADGADGTDGTDGITPSIDSTTKHWMIGQTDTGVVAEGITTVQSDAVNYTATLLAEGWAGASAPYTQTVTIYGLTGTDTPIVDLIPSSPYSTAEAENEAWGKMIDAVTSTNTITFTASAIPAVALNFQVKVI